MFLRFAVRGTKFAYVQRRSDAEAVSAAVAALMDDRNVTPEILSEATGIHLPLLMERLGNESPFMWDEVVAVGGFFAVPTSRLFQGVPA